MEIIFIYETLITDLNRYFVKHLKVGSLFNPLYSGTPLTGTYANSEDADEMPHNAAFHQVLHCL